MPSLRSLSLAAALLVAAAAPASAQTTAAKAPATAASAPIQLRTTPQPAPDSRTALHVLTGQNVVQKPVTLTAKNDSVCFALRVYQVEPVERGSGVTRLTGQSTCVPAKTFNAVVVVDPRR